jgi:hypothetical protein
VTPSGQRNTITIPITAVAAHLRQHAEDFIGPCESLDALEQVKKDSDENFVTT